MRQSKVLPSVFLFFYRLPLLFLTLFVSFLIFFSFCSKLHATFLLVLLLFRSLRFASFWFRFVRLLCQFRGRRVVTNASGAKASLSFDVVYVIWTRSLYKAYMCHLVFFCFFIFFFFAYMHAVPSNIFDILRWVFEFLSLFVGVAVAMRHAVYFISLFCFVLFLCYCSS